MLGDMGSDQNLTVRGQVVAAACFFAATVLIAACGALFPPGDWYACLAKPSWTPPGWVFGPAWTVLYLAIATAGFLAWRASTGRRRRLVLMAWCAQLILNGAWSPIFFGAQRPGLALVDILALLMSIVAAAAIFASVSRLAAALFAPYALWVAFASALNAEIVRLNAG